MLRSYYYSFYLRGVVCFPFILGLFFPNQAVSQSLKAIANTALSENIYLQTDGQVYTKDQTIWFKASVTNAANNTPTELSGVLHVELISPELEVLDKKIIRLENGLGSGFIDLDEQYNSGIYMLRAYTRWNENFGEAFYHKSYLSIAPSSMPDEKTEPIVNVNLVEERKGILLKAVFYPQSIDSLHQLDSRLKVVLTTDVGKDSLNLKNRAGAYEISYPLDDGVSVVNMTMITQNGERFSKTVLVDPVAFNMSFSPQSGHLVHQLVTKVGFVASGPDGRGRKVKGNIVDDRGQVVSSFESNESGVGSFNIIPDSGRKYYAEVERGGKVFKNALPAVQEQGISFSVKDRNDTISLRIQATIDYAQDSIKIQLSHRGLSYYEGVAQLNEAAQLLISMPKDNLPSGVISIELSDIAGTRKASMLHFHDKFNGGLKVDVQLSKKLFLQREKSDLTVNVTDQAGKPVPATLSLITINKKELGQLQRLRENLSINQRLTADFKVEIEKSNQYFDSEGKAKSKQMADLLTALGYRSYKFTQIDIEEQILPEPGLSVSGEIKGVLNKKKSKSGIALTMITFGENSEVYTQTTDSLGRFQFDVGQHYGKEMNVLIQTANKRGKNKDYEVVIDKPRQPEISFDLRKLVQPVDSTVKLLVEKHQERKLIEDAYRSPYDVRDLGEVVVEDYAMTPEREEVTKVHGLPDAVIQGDELREKKANWTFGLFSVLSYTYPDEVRVLRNRNGLEFLTVVGSDITLFLVDGNLVGWDTYRLLANIPVSEVKSFELIKRPKQFAKLFYKLFHPRTPVPTDPALVAIYTHAGKGIPGRSRGAGIFQGAIPVFSPDRQFEAPDHENLTRQDWVKPDYRALIHWEPGQQTNEQGSAHVSFYNADHEGEMMVIVEAISADGQIGYRELTYKVKKRKRK